MIFTLNDLCYLEDKLENPDEGNMKTKSIDYPMP